MPIVKNGAAAPASTPVAQTAPAPVSRKLDTGTQTESRKTGNFDDAKGRRILVQGLTQAVTQSMSLAGLGHTTEEAVVASIKSVTRQLIAFVESES